MALHNKFWLLIPVVLFVAAWGLSSVSDEAGDFLVEAGGLSPAREALFVLPGGAGVGVGVFNVVLVCGVSVVVGVLLSVVRELDFVWDTDELDSDFDEDDLNEEAVKPASRHGGRKPEPAGAGSKGTKARRSGRAITTDEVED